VDKAMLGLGMVVDMVGLFEAFIKLRATSAYIATP